MPSQNVLRNGQTVPFSPPPRRRRGNATHSQLQMRQPHVHYRASPLVSNGVHGFGQGWIQLFGATNDPGEGSAGGGRDSRIIRRRVEADADVLTPAGVAVRVNRQRREL